MNFHYSADRGVQMLLSLFKAYNIKRVIASPGAINIPVVASMQQDTFFEMISCVDERSAAYMACGLAEETGEPVVINCTGATSSRNYMPGLTEAYYRKLPVIALTCSRDKAWIGHLYPQVTDRTATPNDIVVDKAWVQTIKDDDDVWDVNIKLNRVLNSLRYGPIHINMTDAIVHKFDVLELPKANPIRLIEEHDEYPPMPEGRIGIFVGEHKAWTEEETEALDAFCACYDAVVFVDHTSKYQGKYKMLYSIVGAQDGYSKSVSNIDVLIHIGEVSGAYDVFGPLRAVTKYCWRVNPDGRFSDFFHCLKYVFKMREIDFFKHYTHKVLEPKHSFIDACKEEGDKIRKSIPELPFSNLYIGQKIGMLIPDNSILYLGILNTLRTWSFSEINPKVRVYSNTGGFGIDGTLSSAIGSSYADKNRLTFAVLGDLSFFYDMNCIGNHNVGNNIRILLVNNGKGIEFRHYNHQAAFMGQDADAYVAAAGHWGRQSKELVRHFSEDLGFKYLTASNKDEFEELIDEFVDHRITPKPIMFEVFTETDDEIACLKNLREANASNAYSFKSTVKSVLGDKVINFFKKG